MLLHLTFLAPETENRPVKGTKEAAVVPSDENNETTV